MSNDVVTKLIKAEDVRVGDILHDVWDYINKKFQCLTVASVTYTSCFTSGMSAPAVILHCYGRGSKGEYTGPLREKTYLEYMMLSVERPEPPKEKMQSKTQVKASDLVKGDIIYFLAGDSSEITCVTHQENARLYLDPNKTEVGPQIIVQFQGDWDTIRGPCQKHYHPTDLVMIKPRSDLVSISVNQLKIGDVMWEIAGKLGTVSYILPYAYDHTNANKADAWFEIHVQCHL